MKVSIILPLFDRLSTGWKSLESALAQDVTRSSYEVIAIVGGRSEQEATDDPEARALLARCDAVVSFPEDLDLVENHMRFYEAGVRASSGDLLFLAEGHTITHPGCCRLITSYFVANPEARALSAPYREIVVSDLSRLFALLKRRRERQGRVSTPLFSLGGQTAIKRDLFYKLHEVSLRSGLFAEARCCEFIAENRIAVRSIGTPLCDHVSDRSVNWYIGQALGIGKAHFDHFNGFSEYPATLAWPRRVLFNCANRRWFAVMAFPISRAVGTSVLRVTPSVARVSTALAVLALLSSAKSIVLAGFCQARIAA